MTKFQSKIYELNAIDTIIKASERRIIVHQKLPKVLKIISFWYNSFELGKNSIARFYLLMNDENMSLGNLQNTDNIIFHKKVNNLNSF